MAQRFASSGARWLRRRKIDPGMICVAGVAVGFADQRKHVRAEIRPGETANMKKHHLSSWRDGTIGMVDETSVNKFVNPMVEQLPGMNFMHPNETVEGLIILNDSKKASRAKEIKAGMLCAGACRDVWWDRSKVRAAIITNGNICPGINSVIRELTMTLWFQYDVHDIVGINGGFQGLLDKQVVELTPTRVREIHMKGGSVLKPGRTLDVRDPENCPWRMSDTLKEMGINMVFIIGGVGGQIWGNKLFEIARERGVPVSIVGIAKAIDNDVPLFDTSIGYDSGVAAATEILKCGWVEASSCEKGVGIVKLMGRDSGFIAQNAARASTNVDLVLVPEVNWALEDVFEHVDDVIARQGHCVIAVSSGADQSCVGFCGAPVRSVAGHDDIGAFLRDAINKYLKPKGGRSFYIDPSLLIRSVPPVPKESIFCGELARDAVHIAFRGYTGVCVGSVHLEEIAVPMKLLGDKKPRVSPHSSAWQHCVQSCKMPHTLDGNLRH